MYLYAILTADSMKTRLALLLCLFLPLALMAQKITVEEYIEAYKDIAMREMKEHKIPASITLAQGILESGAGNSALAREAKNHFGIKCHKGWEGKTYTMDDDEKDECFRQYKNAEESFRDHSLFLTGRSRYADLFKLDIMDYEGWAKGLKAAGYATNPKYAQLLIERIQLYGLDRYDRIAMGLETEQKPKPARPSKPDEVVLEPDLLFELAYSPTDRSVFPLAEMTEDKRFIYENNGVRFVFAKEGETPEGMAAEFGLKFKKFCEYNCIKRPDEMTFHSGDVVYLAPLKNKNRKAKSYQLAHGETIRDVALRFAVKPERIMKLNHLTDGVPLKQGMTLKLR